MIKRINRSISKLVPLFAICLVVACTDKQPDLGQQSDGIAIHMEVFKQPTCDCCGKWVDHLKGAGFEVKVRDRLNLDTIKREFSIEPRYQSCHTGMVDGYVFEGHIPASLIKQFLEEKPADAYGLAVPGMPIGSPGMEMGERFDSYDVLLLQHNGGSEVYAHIDGS